MFASEIASMVRSGFYSRERLLEVFTEEMYAPGELDTNDVVSAIDAQFAEYEKEKLTYPATTDCDRLDTAFAKMNERGVIAIQNAGYTQSDGYDDVGEAYSQQPEKESNLGYCFYHGQDLERAISGDASTLLFGRLIPPMNKRLALMLVTSFVKNSKMLACRWTGMGRLKNDLASPN
ncbi:MAG: hypothetical protein AAFN77_24585 [Planctomycetota bacterium]